MWEGVGDRTELQHIDPPSIGYNRVSFPFSWAAQPGTWGHSLSGTCSSIQHLLSNSSDPQLSIGGLRAPSAGCWLSLPHLVTNWSGLQNWLIKGLRAHSAGCWLSLPQLVSNWSGLQTNWLPVLTELYNSSTPTFLWASQIALIQPIHGQGYTLLFLDRMHLLFWQPGRVVGQYTTKGIRRSCSGKCMPWDYVSPKLIRLKLLMKNLTLIKVIWIFM